MKKKKELIYEESSGNVFADLGLPNPEERLVKSNLAIQINELIKQKKLTQAKAAELLDADQPKISALKTGKLSIFSLERLFGYLNKLDQNITINVTPKPKTKKPAITSVIFQRIKKPKSKKQDNHENLVPMYAKKSKE